MDTFHNMQETAAPVASPAANTTQASNDPNFETFENFEELSDEAKPEEEEKSEKVASKKKSVDPDSTVNLLDEEEKGEEDSKKGKKDTDSEEDDEESVENKDDEGGSEEEDDEGSDNSEEGAEDFNSAKKARGSFGGKKFEIPEETMFRQKVKNKWETVSLKELKDNWSGKVVYDEKFETLESRNTELEERETKITQVSENLQNQFGSIKALMEQGQAGEVSPLAVLDYVVDLIGGDKVEYNKNLYEQLSGDMEAYGTMTDLERDAYWTKQQNDIYKEQQERQAKSNEDVQSQQEVRTQIDKAMTDNNLTEDQMQGALKALKESGQEDISLHDITEMAILSPLYERAGGLLAKYKEQLSTDEFTSELHDLVDAFRNIDDLTDEEITEGLAEKYELEDILEELEIREDTTKRKKGATSLKKRESTAMESWDDI